MQKSKKMLDIKHFDTNNFKDLLAYITSVSRYPFHYDVVESSVVPDSFRYLLEHDSLMTIRLESFYNQKLDLKVLNSELLPDVRYQRKIALGVKSNSKEFIVIAKAWILIDLKACPEDLKQKILEGKTPFGKILSSYGIRYRVTCYHILKINEWKELDLGFPSPCYGRLAKIFLDDVHIVDVLEVVSNTLI